MTYATSTLPRPASALVVSERARVLESIDQAVAAEDYVLLPATERQDVFTWIQDLPPDIVLVDHGAEGQGLELLRELGNDPRITPWTPRFLIHDQAVERAAALLAYQAGAWDVLQLPFDQELTTTRLRNMVVGKLEADDAHENAFMDEATGLYTWRGLVERAEELASLAVRHHRAIACVAFAPDLDHADLAGTETERLRKIARGMAVAGRRTVRRSDLMGTAGGPTDFIVLAPDTNPAGAEVLAKRLTEETRKAVDGAVGFRTRAGFYGVVDMMAAGIRPVDLLMRAARALRAAQAGRLADAVRFYDSASG